MTQIQAVIAWCQANWANILVVLSAVYGLLAAIVKAFPTLPVDHWLLPIIKFLGKLTNNQTDDAAIRAAQK
jgi:hypothetical protein